MSKGYEEIVWPCACLINRKYIGTMEIPQKAKVERLLGLAAGLSLR
jgi:hypothetical protein